MKEVFIIAAAGVFATAAWAEWLYEGRWGSFGTGNGQFNRPEGIGVSPNGTVYVTDTTNDRVQYFTPTGSFRGKWGKSGTGKREFRSPRGIAVAPDTNVYVADMNNDRIKYFTATGSYLGQWGKPGTGVGEFNVPLNPTVAPNSNIYVCDRDNNRIQYFTPTGSFLGSWGGLVTPHGAEHGLVARAAQGGSSLGGKRRVQGIIAWPTDRHSLRRRGAVS